MVRRLAPDRATQVSFYRLLANSAVTVEGLLDAQAAADGLGAGTGHVLALTDTTALDLRRQAGRLRPDTVGPLSSAGNGLGCSCTRSCAWRRPKTRPDPCWV